MYAIEFSPTFIKGYKKCLKKHWDASAVEEALRVLAQSDKEKIPAKFNDHSLSGAYKGSRELHLGGKNSSWLIIHKIEDGTAKLVATGTHDEIL